MGSVWIEDDPGRDVDVDPEAALTLDDLGTFDAYTHRHSVQVAALGLLIARRAWTREGWIDYRGGRRCDRFGDRMRKLANGLLVHDVGKLAVPPEVLNEPARLSDAEMAVMRTTRRRASSCCGPPTCRR